MRAANLYTTRAGGFLQGHQEGHLNREIGPVLEQPIPPRTGPSPAAVSMLFWLLVSLLGGVL